MSGLVEHMLRRAELMESLADPAQPKATLAWQVEAQATLAKGARDNELAAAEITRLQAENAALREQLEKAREALEEIARQRLPFEIDDDPDPDFPTGYEGCILRARLALKDKEERG